jgi:hypothetical protein
MRIQCFALLIVLLTRDFVFGQDSGRKLLDECIKYRASIRQIELDFSLRGEDDVEIYNGTAWCDYDRGIFRTDFNYKINDSEGERIVFGKSCEFEGFCLKYTESSRSADPILLFFKDPPSGFGLLNAKCIGFAVDRLELVTINPEVLTWGRWLELLSRSEVTKDELNDLVEIKFSQISPTGRVSADATIDRTKGPSIVAGRLMVEHLDRNFSSGFQAELEQQGDLWFPEKITFFGESGNMNSAIQLRLSGIKTRIGEFSNLTYFGLKEGTLVLGAPGHEVGGFEWRRGKIEPVSLVPASDMGVTPRAVFSRWFLVLNIAAVFLLAGIYLWRTRVIR